MAKIDYITDFKYIKMIIKFINYLKKQKLTTILKILVKK